MEIDTVKRVFFWVSMGIFLIILMVLGVSARIAFGFRVLIVLLIAFFSSYYRFDNKYSFISFLVTIFAGIIIAIVMASAMWQFWLFLVMFVVGFFLACMVVEKNLLGV